MAKGGIALAAVIGIAALAAGSAGGASPKPRPVPPTPKPPRPGPDENEGTVPEEIRQRVALAIATQDPALIRAEATRLRKEGWTAQAESLEAVAVDIEARQHVPQPPTPPAPKPPAPTPVTPPRDLARGMKGADVKAWQQQLVADGFVNVAIDSDFGEQTYAATKEWQWQREIKDDGIVGPKTREKIGTRATRTRTAPPTPAPAPSPVKPPAPSPVKPPAPVPAVRDLARGMKGADVKAWQEQLRRDGYVGVEPDGDFGEITYAGTKAWQWEREVKDDGIVGPKTREKIGTAPTRKPQLPTVTPPPAPVKPPAPQPGVKPPPVAPSPPPAPTTSGKVPALLAGVTLRPVPPPEPTDERVRLWQDKLKALGYRSATTKSDGKFGPNTSTQTAAFQRDRGIDPTGIADPVTIATAYGEKPKASTPAKPPAPTPAPSPAVPPLLVNLSNWRSVLKLGNKGEDVREWQRVLMRYGYTEIKDDGDFGPKTHDATKQWQTQYARFNDPNRKPLVPDGEVGKNTRDRIAELERGKSIVAGELDMLPAKARAALLPMLSASTPQLLGVELDRHLRATPPGMEDRELVARFQRTHGLNDTGVYGPATAEALIPLGIIPPDPREWPTKKLMRTKFRYRTALREQAKRDPERAQDWLNAAARV